MERIFRSILLKIIGLHGYLAVVSDIYIRLIKIGFFKKKYPEMFYLKNIINNGDVCLDIGANVGYYSVFLSKLTGKSGRVFSIEPVPLFANIFLINCKKFALDNITLYQTALGSENKKIEMGTPFIDGVFRHGLTKVIDDTNKHNLKTFEAEMRIPDELFADFEKLNFIKCDVEGYEVHLFPHLLQTIKKFKPAIQIEISSVENRKQIFELLQPLGYKIFTLSNSKLNELKAEDALHYNQGDFYLKA